MPRAHWNTRSQRPTSPVPCSRLGARIPDTWSLLTHFPLCQQDPHREEALTAHDRVLDTVSKNTCLVFHNKDTNKDDFQGEVGSVI